jgi:hypothetical protein
MAMKTTAYIIRPGKEFYELLTLRTTDRRSAVSFLPSGDAVQGEAQQDTLYRHIAERCGLAGNDVVYLRKIGHLADDRISTDANETPCLNVRDLPELYCAVDDYGLEKSEISLQRNHKPWNHRLYRGTNIQTGNPIS